MGLWPYRDRRPAGFSFSMKQRLALVIALVNDPEFLILDEPFVDLDPDGVLQLIAAQTVGFRPAGIAMLISSCRSCATTLFIKGGRLADETSISRRRDAGDAPGISCLYLNLPLFYSPAAATDPTPEILLFAVGESGDLLAGNQITAIRQRHIHQCRRPMAQCRRAPRCSADGVHHRIVGEIPHHTVTANE
ncbi:MAG: ATP-binding cassette domain-containing protein [Bifidobacterium longum]